WFGIVLLHELIAEGWRHGFVRREFAHHPAGWTCRGLARRQDRDRRRVRHHCRHRHRYRWELDRDLAGAETRHSHCERHRHENYRSDHWRHPVAARRRLAAWWISTATILVILKRIDDQSLSV